MQYAEISIRFGSFSEASPPDPALRSRFAFWQRRIPRRFDGVRREPRSGCVGQCARDVFAARSCSSLSTSPQSVCRCAVLSGPSRRRRPRPTCPPDDFLPCTPRVYGRRRGSQLPVGTAELSASAIHFGPGSTDKSVPQGGMVLFLFRGSVKISTGAPVLFGAEFSDATRLMSVILHILSGRLRPRICSAAVFAGG